MGEAEDAFAPPRRRRSTYTPPPQYRDVVAPPEPEQSADLPVAADVAGVAETRTAARVEAPAAAPVEAPASAPVPVETAAAAPAPVETPTSVPVVAETSAPPAAPATPSTPRRRSLPDEELLSVVHSKGSRPGGTLDAIDVLESEMLLREEEVLEYRAWEDTMLAVGTPEALAEVARVRPEFSTIVVPEQLATSQIPVQTGFAPITTREPSGGDRPAAAAHRTPVRVDTTPAVAPAGAESTDGPVEPAPVFGLELSGLRPTPVDYRVGRASRLFWLWFAANSSLVSVAFGAGIFSLGMSLRQSIVATLAGVALSFIPLGLGTLAGKRSGQPTVVVSRAAFGVTGNIVPAVLSLVSRVFWGAVLLWLFAISIATVIGGGTSTSGLVIVLIAVGAMLAVVVAFLGYGLLARFQLVASIVSAALVVGFVAITAGRVDVTTALSQTDGPWVLVVTGAVLVFSFVGLVWANSSADLARYQRPAGSSGASMLWATFGTAVPTFALIAYGALLAASDPSLAAGLASRPIETIETIVPGWYSVPLIATIGVSLLSAVIVTVYSGAFALQGVGLRLERQGATLVVGVLLAIVAGLISAVSVDLTTVFRDLATTLAVPVAAWAGIFAADTMIRNRPVHTASLLGRGGVYPSVNWINLPAFVGITVLCWGLTSASSVGLAWQGYLLAAGGVSLDSDLAASDIGVVVALVLGLLTPIVSGVPTIRRQEAAAELV
jgi:purine-cytosine permease-like protein